MQQTETLTVDAASVTCDGGSERLGHPKVTLSLADGRNTCPYCSQTFVLHAGAKAAHGH